MDTGDRVNKLPAPYYETELGKLYHGDCLEILPHLEPVDLVLTDPPYGLGKRLHDGGTWATAEKYDAMLDWDTETQQTAIAKILEHTGEK